MFPNINLEELNSNAIYEFSSRTPLYLQLLKYFEDLFDYPKAIEQWKEFGPMDKNENLWWVMNEGWASYGTVNPDLPIRWLAISKRALHWNHVPGNFHSWALAILESFDLERYNAAYHLPAEELKAVAQDLPVVLSGLRGYPRENFAPPIDETKWGLSDQ